MSSFPPHQPAVSSNGAYPGAARSSDGRNRVLQGVPSGGQFAAERHSDAVISLNLNRAPQPPAYIRIPQQAFKAVRSLVSGTIRKVRGRSMQDRPYDRPRAFTTRAKIAVAGLAVAAAAAAGIAANNPGSIQACQAAPAIGTTVTATTTVYTPPAPVMPHTPGVPIHSDQSSDTIRWIPAGEQCPAPATPPSNT